MSDNQFRPTPQQGNIISHAGSAFITACPGAGKTGTMVERARQIFPELTPGRGVGFLSFTRSAIAELEGRMRQQGILPSPLFPSFIGTFDSFVWQFFIAPFGVPGCAARPRLIPDLRDRVVVPFDRAQPLTLSCFSASGDIDRVAAKRVGFDASQKPAYQLKAYSTMAARIRSTAREQGEIDFDEARSVALERIEGSADAKLGTAIARALSARFVEIVVDEAQDCNPDDLTIVSWLLQHEIPVKVICDPHQSIYGFRGGVTDHLFKFSGSFKEGDCHLLSGNFRSSRNICRAISLLRPPSCQDRVDEAVGDFKDLPHPVNVLSYRGTSVPATIGDVFLKLVKGIGESLAKCPVLAATRSTGAAALGRSRDAERNDSTFRLARAVMDFHFASCFSDIKAALDEVHKILLDISGELSGTSYHKYLADMDIKPESWRPKMMQILRDLRFDPDKFSDARTWHSHAKSIIGSNLSAAGAASISQKLKWNSGLETLLLSVAPAGLSARTIHSVKGLEFPAVCVVTTAATLKRILDYLETEAPSDSAEAARELYVAASRAQKLLVFASPKSQAARLSAHLRKQGAEVTLEEV